MVRVVDCKFVFECTRRWIRAPRAIGTQGFFTVPLRGKARGRARVTVSYSDGTQHVASFFVLPPLDEHVAQYAQFISTTAWYDNVTDPFARGHS